MQVRALARPLDQLAGGRQIRSFSGNGQGAPTVSGIIVWPFQGDAHVFRVENPGRCPGLICECPFGAKRQSGRLRDLVPKGQ